MQNAFEGLRKEIRNMRTLGTVVRGVRAPIFRQGDDAVAVTVELSLIHI